MLDMLIQYSKVFYFCMVLVVHLLDLSKIFSYLALKATSDRAVIIHSVTPRYEKLRCLFLIFIMELSSPCKPSCKGRLSNLFYHFG